MEKNLRRLSLLLNIVMVSMGVSLFFIKPNVATNLALGIAFIGWGSSSLLDKISGK